MISSIVVSRINLLLNVGKAVPGPKIASVLGPRGIAIPKFCEAFNKVTGISDKYKAGEPVTARVVVYDNRSYDLSITDPPVAYLLKQATGIAKGASNPGKEVISKVNMSVVIDIAKRKMIDMKINKLESAVKMVLGTACSMGIEIVEE